MPDVSHRRPPAHMPFPLNELSNLVQQIDVLWFRWLSVATSFGGIAYKVLFPRETPLHLVVAWNIVFIGINLIHIAILLLERKSIRFSEQEQELYETVFNKFTPVEFMKLLRIAQWEEAPSGTVLSVQDQPLDDMMLIYSGGANVEIDGECVAHLRDGTFIGEMSLITQGPASATVTLCEPTRYVKWPKAELKNLLERNPAMSGVMQSVVATDLTKKLLMRDNA